MFDFKYIGAVNMKRGNPVFEIEKFGVGAYDPNTLVSGEEEQNGYFFSPQYVGTLFEMIKKQKKITIVKKSDSLTDRGISETLKKRRGKTFAMYFSKTADDGVNYFHKDLTIYSAFVESSLVFQESGQHFSVFTITGKKATTSLISGLNGTITSLNSLED